MFKRIECYKNLRITYIHSFTKLGTNGDNIINVTEGTIVTAEYTDADIDGLAGGTATLTAYTTAEITTPITTPTTTVTDEGGSSGAVNDKISFLFTILGFLLIGGFQIRMLHVIMALRGRLNFHMVHGRKHLGPPIMMSRNITL